MKTKWMKQAAALLMSIPLSVQLCAPGLTVAAVVAGASSLTGCAPENAVGDLHIAKEWAFQSDGQEWYFDTSWAGDSYRGAPLCEWDAEKQMLRVGLDFSKNTNDGWCQPAVSVEQSGGFDFSGCNAMSLDLYYDSAAFTTGNITLKVVAGNLFNEQMAGVFTQAAEPQEGTLKKVTLKFAVNTAAAANEHPEKLMLLLVGNNTDYNGSLWLDNICLYQEELADLYVDTTVKAQTETRLESDGMALTVNGMRIEYADEVQLADPQASDKAKKVYQYLKAVGTSEAVLFGHMEDTVLKAGSSELSDSDTEDLTGSVAALVGLDCGNLFVGFAEKYNARHPESDPLPSTTEGNITAAARLTNDALEEGAIMTLSAHMPNFAFAALKDPDAEKSYDRYDYTQADSYNLKGDCMNEILPGGAYNEAFTAYLDMVAEYAQQVDGAILFRPFHENTGSWFWWGKAFCAAETYKSVYKYTVEYLRDTKGVHNILYLYGPGSEAANLAEYGERYPGDAYVDLIGFDTYDSNPEPGNTTFMPSFENTVALTSEFAKQHGKLFAVTETGISSMNDQQQIRSSWYEEMLEILKKPEYQCTYFMLWTNYNNTSYYTPYVVSRQEDGTLHGHSMMDDFIRFYNRSESIFAQDQKAVLSGTVRSAQQKEAWPLSGYFTKPLSGSRVLEATEILALLNCETETVQITVSNGEQEFVLPTTVTGRKVSAVLDAATLAALGECTNGKLKLTANGAVLQEQTLLYNVAAKEKDPLEIDDFEGYYGEAALLNSSWAVNKDSGSALTISLVEQPVLNSGYALEFAYNETKNGWAGATIAHEADWSGCNALEFYVVPDGKNQKTVIQINTADGGSYEAYLNNYANYASAPAGTVLKVTLPFSEFVDKGDRGALTSEAAAEVSNFGLWLNAIPDSEAVSEDGVSGVLYYDAIRAVNAGTKPVIEPVGGKTCGWKNWLACLGFFR